MRWPRSTPEARGGELQVNELLPASPEAATAHGLTERDVLKPRTTTRPRAASSRAGRRACCSHMRKNAGLGCLRVCRGAADSAGDGGGGEKVGAFGAYRDGMEVYGRATASQHRELVSLADFSHYELYDQPEAVREALDKVLPFFAAHLGE